MSLGAPYSQTQNVFSRQAGPSESDLIKIAELISLPVISSQSNKSSVEPLCNETKQTQRWLHRELLSLLLEHRYNDCQAIAVCALAKEERLNK